MGYAAGTAADKGERRMVAERPIKRAIALAGGGPAVGLSIGALKSLKRAGITFDVWTCACIGAWLGVVYNQAEPGREVEDSVDFLELPFQFKSSPAP